MNLMFFYQKFMKNLCPPLAGSRGVVADGLLRGLPRGLGRLRRLPHLGGARRTLHGVLRVYSVISME